MKEYVKNTKKYVENMNEYEEISRYIRFGTPISIWTLGLGKISRRSFLLIWRVSSRVRAISLKVQTLKVRISTKTRDEFLPGFEIAAFHHQV